MPRQARCSVFRNSRFADSEHEVDDHGSQQGHSEHGGTEPVIEATLATPPNALGSPVEGEKRVDHRRHGDQREQAG